jgi:hypothetical protein
VTAALVIGVWLAVASASGIDAIKAPPEGSAEYATLKAALAAQLGSGAKGLVVANDCMSLGCGTYGHWGLRTVAGDPANPADDEKRLIYDSSAGATNGLAVMIDGNLFVLGDSDTAVTQPLALGEGGAFATIAWTLDGVVLTARYEVVASASGRADTGRFTYTFANPPGAAPRRVSLKVGLDTRIGESDRARLVTASGLFARETGFGVTGGGGSYRDPVPDFWQAFEVDNPAAPGTVGQGTFVGGGATRPDKFVVGQWPGVAYGPHFDYTPTGAPYGDSAVAMWWFDRELAAGASLSIVVLYGLGTVSGGGTGLRLSVAAPETLELVGGDFVPNPFTVLAQVQNHSGATLENLPVVLGLPAGLSVADGGSATRSIAALADGATALVSFSVVADPAYGGQTLAYTVTAGSGDAGAFAVEKAVRLPVVFADCANSQGLDVVIESSAIHASCPLGSSPASAVFRVRNGCTGTLDYTVGATLPWLSVSPAAGTSTGEWDEITVAFSTSELPVGDHDAEITVSGGGRTETVTVQVQVLESSVPCTAHQADQNGDGVIQLAPELTRLIQFYNRRGYHCQEGTEDGYAPAVGTTLCAPHQADRNGDWVIQLPGELTRIIQFYNSGGYHCEAGTEDGFAPGPARRKAAAPKGTLTAARSFGSARYASGGTLDVSVTLSHSAPAALSSLAVCETLPAGWSFDRVVGGSTPFIMPPAGATDTLGFAWIVIPSLWPVTLTYRVKVPPGSSGAKRFSGTPSYREDADEVTVTTAATTIESGPVTVTLMAGSGGSIRGATPQAILPGADTSPVTAVADYGFLFTQWDDGETANPRTLRGVSASITRTALFRPANDVNLRPGEFTAVVDAAAAGRGLWDLTGSYGMTVGDHPMVLALVADPGGRITGTGTYTAGTATAPLCVRGSVRGQGGAVSPRVSLKVRDATDAGDYVSLAFDLTLDASHARLAGVMTGRVGVGGVAIPAAGASVVLDIPATMDGSWALQVQLAPSARTVSGTAQLRLSNGVSYAYTLGGRRSGQTALSVLTAAPSDPAARRLAIRTAVVVQEGDWARLDALLVRGYGQSVFW